VYPDRLGADFLGDPDAWFFPVPGTLSPIPWAQTPTAQVLTTALHDGAPVYFDPRGVLARVVEAFAAQGITPVTAFECEFYLLQAGDDGPRPAEPPGALPGLTGPQCLSMEALSDFENFIRDLESICQDQGVPLTIVHAEYGDAQFEANLHHVPDALAACDHLTRLKRIIKSVARKHDVVASFMAKPITGATGSGLHSHVSLLDAGGNNVFAGSDGITKLHHAIGGVLQTTAEAMALFCPNANSYRRFQPDSYVPQGLSWGPNHRLVAVRVPPSGDADRRLEHRIAGADACPYLMLAGVLAGMLHGLTNNVEPTRMTGEKEELFEAARFPNRWPVALDAFENGSILPGYLGAQFHELYLNVKRQEEARFNAAVTTHDLDWYFRVV
ncbi:MAG: glutamine synthetase, partial [Rhizobiales bacterium]|nr:glutamine synthetase [Hyphomicrobiales bacterium]